MSERDIVNTFARMTMLVQANAQLLLDSADLKQIYDCADVWAQGAVPMYGLLSEKASAILIILFDATYCMGYAAGRRAASLSNWQVAPGEDKDGRQEIE